VSFKIKLLAGLAVAVLLWFGQWAWDYLDNDSIPNVSMQYGLKQFGGAVYEFHATNGRWPQSLEDLGGTSFLQQYPAWKSTPVVILWPKDLKPDPKDNAGVLLAYYPVGLFNKLGRVWVCWGDLRTEHLPERDLRPRLPR